MNKIKDYQIVGATSIDSVAKLVNQMIAEGYQPFGNLIAINDESDGTPYLYQVMVIYQD